MPEEKSRYKYCIVPMCKNTSITTPEKIFLSVPKIPKVRKKWCLAMKRNSNRGPPLASKSNRHCCEDHFNLKEDTENYYHYTRMGGILKLKPHIVPHLYDCQKHNSEYSETNNVAEENLNVFIKTEEPPSICDNSNLREIKMEDSDDIINYPSTSKDDEVCTLERSLTSDDLSYEDGNIEIGSGIEFSLSESNSDHEISKFDKSSKVELIRIETLMDINRDPQSFIGIFKSKYHVVKTLSTKAEIPLINVLITLRKIKLNESFENIGIKFGMTGTNVCDIFKKSVPMLATLLQVMIIKPEDNKIIKFLPKRVQTKYSRARSVVDCLELQIEKPADVVHQKFTWSVYRGCNSVKYLVSYTPDGLINYISCGYAGSASDAVMIDNCGFFGNLSPGMWVMADRSFENIADRLLEHGCKIVPVSNINSVDLRSTLSENSVPPDNDLKQIEQMKCHVEHVISRIRHFRMLLPDTCIDRNHISIIDEIVVIVCALVNLQNDYFN